MAPSNILAWYEDCWVEICERFIMLCMFMLSFHCTKDVSILQDSCPSDLQSSEQASTTEWWYHSHTRVGYPSVFLFFFWFLKIRWDTVSSFHKTHQPQPVTQQELSISHKMQSYSFPVKNQTRLFVFTYISGLQPSGFLFLWPIQMWYTTDSEVSRFGYGSVPEIFREIWFLESRGLFFFWERESWILFTLVLATSAANSPNVCISHRTMPNAQTSPLKL